MGTELRAHLYLAPFAALAIIFTRPNLRTAAKDAGMAEIMEALRRIEHNQKQQGQELKQQGHKLDAMNRLMGVVVERQAYSEAGPLLARVFPRTAKHEGEHL